MGQLAAHALRADNQAREKTMDETTECVYCGAEVPAMSEDEKPPAVADREAWTELAKQHAEDCEWIYTRAHRVMETILDG